MGRMVALRANDFLCCTLTIIRPRLWSSKAHYRNTMSPTTPGIHLKLKEVRTEYHPIDAMAACTAAWCLPTVSAQIVHIGVGDRTAGLLPQNRELSPAMYEDTESLTWGCLAGCHITGY